MNREDAGSSPVARLRSHATGHSMNVMPLLYDRFERRALEAAGVECPVSIPRDYEATRKHCLASHGQTPEKLAERGGLGASEAIAILRGWSRPQQSPGLSDPGWVEYERREITELVALLDARSRAQ